MNPPLFELAFEHGPFDGWQVTTNYLPTETLALPARPDRATSLRSACRAGALSRARELHAQYALAGKQMILVHGIPVVRMQFQFDHLAREQAARERGLIAGCLAWLRDSLAWWLGRRQGSGLTRGAQLVRCTGLTAASVHLSGRNPYPRG